MARAREDVETIIFDEDYPDVPVKAPALTEEALESWSDYSKEEGLKMTLYKEAETGKQDQCFTFYPADYPEPSQLQDRARIEYGPGRYYIKCYQRGKLTFNQNFSIARPNNTEKSEHPGASRVQSDNNFLMMIMQQQQRQQEISTQQQQHQQEMMMQMMQQNSNNMVQLLTAVMAGKRDIDPVALQSSFMTQLAGFKEVFGEQRSTFDSVREAIAMARELTEEPDAEKSVYSVFEKMVDRLGGPVMRMIENSPRKSGDEETQKDALQKKLIETKKREAIAEREKLLEKSKSLQESELTQWQKQVNSIVNNIVDALRTGISVEDITTFIIDNASDEDFEAVHEAYKLLPEGGYLSDSAEIPGELKAKFRAIEDNIQSFMYDGEPEDGKSLTEAEFSSTLDESVKKVDTVENTSKEAEQNNSGEERAR